jgi:hypothetical protein
MRTWIGLGLASFCCIGFSSASELGTGAKLLPALQPYVLEIANELGQVSEERRDALGKIAVDIVARLEAGDSAQLTFICTHNSRRSHMSQIWAQTAACYYGLDRVRAYSGGTEVTACNWPYEAREPKRTSLREVAPRRRPPSRG